VSCEPNPASLPCRCSFSGDEQQELQNSKQILEGAKAAEQTRAFANQLFEGAVHDSKALDELISKHAVTGAWNPSVIDRAILRLALHEMRARTRRRKW